MAIILSKMTSSGAFKVGSITKKPSGYFWHGFTEGRATSARKPNQTVQGALASAKKALGDVQAFDAETQQYL